jgi:hypothetical protein
VVSERHLKRRIALADDPAFAPFRQPDIPPGGPSAWGPPGR